MSKFVSPAILVLIFFIGFLLRSQEVISNNYLFLKDQGRDMLDVKAIVLDHKPTLIGPYTGLQGIFQGPLYYYFLAIPTAISRGDPIGPMIFILLINLFSIVMGYIIGKKFFSEITGLLAAFLISVSPGAAAAATFIWSPHLLVPLISLYIFFLLYWRQKPSIARFSVLAVCIGLFYHAEMAFAVPLTMATAVLFSFLLSRKKYISYGAVFLSIILVFLSPLIIFDFKHDHISSRSFMALLSGHTQGLADSFAPFRMIIGDHLYRFGTILDSSFMINNPVIGYFSALFILLSVWFLIFHRDRYLTVLILLPALFYGAYLLYPFGITHWYLIGLFILFPVIMGIFLGKLTVNRIGKSVVLIVILLLTQNAAIRIQKLYTHYDDGGTAKIKGKLAAIDVIYQDSGGRPFNLLVFTPVVLTDAYDYLLWWHGLKTYGYLPGKEIKQTFYLLAEPDPGKPWSYKGWMETVIKNGKVIWTKELPTGFVIEKRII